MLGYGWQEGRPSFGVVAVQYGFETLQQLTLNDGWGPEHILKSECTTAGQPDAWRADIQQPADPHTARSEAASLHKQAYRQPRK